MIIAYKCLLCKSAYPLRSSNKLTPLCEYIFRRLVRLLSYLAILMYLWLIVALVVLSLALFVRHSYVHYTRYVTVVTSAGFTALHSSRRMRWSLNSVSE